MAISRTTKCSQWQLHQRRLEPTRAEIEILQPRLSSVLHLHLQNTLNFHTVVIVARIRTLKVAALGTALHPLSNRRFHSIKEAIVNIHQVSLTRLIQQAAGKFAFPAIVWVPFGKGRGDGEPPAVTSKPLSQPRREVIERLNT